MIAKKRKQLDYSSDEQQYSDYEPPNKKHKMDGENKKTLIKMLKVSSVLLQDENVKKKFEIVINDDKKSYSFIEGKIGTNPKRKIKKFSSKKKAFNAALNTLMTKTRNNWSITVSDGEESESEDDSSLFFTGFMFSLSGAFNKTQNEITKLINNNGGIVKASVNNKTDFVLVPNDPNLKSMKCINATSSNIPIVSEDYLYDCIDAGQRLQHNAYIIDKDEDIHSEYDDKYVKKNENKTKLKKFIKIHMNQSDLDRDEMHEFPFKNIGEFYKHNFKIIDKLNKKMINKLLILKELIENGENSDTESDNALENGNSNNNNNNKKLIFNVMDKKDMIPWRASGFCFDKKGELIIFHER